MVIIDWNSFDRGVFLVNCLAIIYNPKTKKILIGKREPDPYIKELRWSFPGGRPAYGRTLEKSLKDEVKKKTNLKVNVKKLIFARLPREVKEFLLLYYYCETNARNAKAGEKFTEIKWIKPAEAKKYFSTSVDPFIMKFLKQLK
jgi:ADP-ribose pyrophosphatase YjhB (NUDIX family)